MLLLTTNKKPRYIIHGVHKDTLIILHTPQRAVYITLIFLYFGRYGVSNAQNQRFHDPSRDMEEHLTVICPVTGYPTQLFCLVCPVTGQIDPAYFKMY